MQLFGRKNKEDQGKIKKEEIEEVVDTLAYKYSIPQGIIRNIIWTWMQFEQKRVWGHD